MYICLIVVYENKLEKTINFLADFLFRKKLNRFL